MGTPYQDAVNSDRRMVKLVIAMGLLLASVGCIEKESQSLSARQKPIVESVQLLPADTSLEPSPGPEIQQAQAQSPLPVDDLTDPEQPHIEPNDSSTAQTPGQMNITEASTAAELAVAEPNLVVAAAPEADELGKTTAAESVEATPADPNTIKTPGPKPQSRQTQESQPEVMKTFRTRYAQVLQEYVRANGLVNYGPLRRHRLRLKRLLAEPDALDPNVYEAWPRNEKMAFWINTYNLKMLDVIARNYPIQSSMWLRLTWTPSDIRHIKGIWSDYRFIVMDEEFTLGEVERRIFRRTFADPRVFLALTSASRSSPLLRRTPYSGPELDQQLDEQVRAFLATEEAFMIDRMEGIVYLSALFKPTWRGKEFVAAYGTDKKFKSRDPETRAVLNFITKYVSAEDVYFLEVENYALKYINFDWRLNDTAKGY